MSLPSNTTVKKDPHLTTCSTRPRERRDGRDAVARAHVRESALIVGEEYACRHDMHTCICSRDFKHSYTIREHYSAGSEGTAVDQPEPYFCSPLLWGGR